MELDAQTRRISDAAAACAAADDPDELLAALLPVLHESAGAAATLALRMVGGGELIAVAHAGRPLAADDLAAGTGPPDPAEEAVADVDVPGPWAADGVTRVVCRRLGPQRERFLVLAFDDAGAPGPWHDAVATLVEATMARLVAQAALADLTQRVDSAQQLANMGDYDWHIPTDTNRWSDQLYRIYGHEPQSFNASYERFLSLIHPDDRERITAIHQSAYASGEPYWMIERIVRPDGEIRYLSSNGQVIMDDEGTPVRMRGTCIDVTDRILAERAREESAARFRDLVESSPDAILVIDADGLVLDANPHAAGLLGGDPTGRPIDAVVATPLRTKEDVAATGFDGRALRLDVTTVDLQAAEDEGLVAAFLRDATVRLESEALAARLAEAQVRRRQALEINDNVVQGLTAATNALQAGNPQAAGSYVDGTLASARKMMNDLLQPLDGSELAPGDLVRAAPAVLEMLTAGTLPTAAPEPVPVPAPRPGPTRVLVVDDAEDIRMLVRIRLEGYGSYEVVGEAADGEEAVAMATELQPDVVLLDLAMPKLDGLQALPRICSAVEGVRVVVLSGFDADPMAEKALAAGARRYVEKGRAISGLDEVLAEVLAED